jgi:hypothetical protein
MMGELHFEWWVFPLFLALLIIPPILIGLGVYYFISQKYSVTSLVIPVIILVLANLLAYSGLFTTTTGDSKGINFIFAFIAFPASVWVGFFFDAKNYAFLFYLISFALNYLCFFGVINFIHKLFVRIKS